MALCETLSFHPQTQTEQCLPTENLLFYSPPQSRLIPYSFVNFTIGKQHFSVVSVLDCLLLPICDQIAILEAESPCIINYFYLDPVKYSYIC